MSTLNPTIPASGYGGGDDAGPRNVLTDYAGRLRRARLAMAITITPITMLFVSFTSAYVIRRGLPVLDDKSMTYVSDWIGVHLPVRLLLINTLLLVISTITMELARRQMARRTALTPVQTIPGVSIGDERSYPWLAITAILGFGFLAGQWIAWRQLASQGVYVATTPSSSFIYLLTVSHAVHLFGGVLAMAAVLILSMQHRQPERQYIIVDAASWYWHFMALLWIYIFGLLQFAK
jgi:cytochrome c oxidase subunit 3